MYLLRCVDGSLYCGWTNHLDQRLAAHAEGRGGRYTRSKRPVRLVLEFVCESPTQARRLEALVKRLTKKEKEALLTDVSFCASWLHTKTDSSTVTVIRHS